MSRLEVVLARAPDYKVGVATRVWNDDLDAIEAAAVAEERARLRAAVEGLEEHWVNGSEWDYGINRFLDYAAVLALLEEQPTQETIKAALVVFKRFAGSIKGSPDFDPVEATELPERDL